MKRTAPRTPALSVMHAAGRLFPMSDRAPSIEPVSPKSLHRAIGEAADLQGFRVLGGEKISRGFYTSHSLELARPIGPSSEGASK